MLQRRFGIQRAIAAAVLVLSATVTVLLPIADARAEMASRTAQAHVEQPGSTRCPQVHDELACQICRVLRLVGSGCPARASVVVFTVADIPPAAQVTSLPASRVEPSASPRAPPTA